MRSSKGTVSAQRLLIIFKTDLFYRDGAANLNDMKEMLANLPQYQEQREKVWFIRHLPSLEIDGL